MTLALRPNHASSISYAFREDHVNSPREPLAIETSLPRNNSIPYVYPAPHPTTHNFTSISTRNPEAVDLITIFPPLALDQQEKTSYPVISRSEIDETTTYSHGRCGPTHWRSPSGAPVSATQARKERYNPMAGMRPYRPTEKNVRHIRREGYDPEGEEDVVAAEEPMDFGTSSSERRKSDKLRREELRNKYTELKRALPASNQKSSKISLLDHAVTYILQLETSNSSLQTQLEKAEIELARVRAVNEQLTRNLAEQYRVVVIAASANSQVVSSASATVAGSALVSPAGQQEKHVRADHLRLSLEHTHTWQYLHTRPTKRP